MEIIGLVVREVSAELPARFERLSELKILHISDMHLVAPDRLMEERFAGLARLKPDLVMVTGDLIDDDRGIEWAGKCLNVFKPKHGLWVSLGNHDKYDIPFYYTVAFRFLGVPKANDVGKLQKAVEQAGGRLLISESAKISVRGVPIRIIGTDVSFGFDRNIDKRPYASDIETIRRVVRRESPQEYVIILAHMPDMVMYPREGEVDLALCGHTHGGQARLPLVGPLVAYSPFQRQYNVGFFRYKGFGLNVSAGIGSSLASKYRFNNPSEVTMIILKKE